jgi:uncharacterized protein (TIGR02145 family)
MKFTSENFLSYTRYAFPQDFSTPKPSVRIRIGQDLRNFQDFKHCFQTREFFMNKAKVTLSAAIFMAFAFTSGFSQSDTAYVPVLANVAATVSMHPPAGAAGAIGDARSVAASVPDTLRLVLGSGPTPVLQTRMQMYDISDYSLFSLSGKRIEPQSNVAEGVYLLIAKDASGKRRAAKVFHRGGSFNAGAALSQSGLPPLRKDGDSEAWTATASAAGHADTSYIFSPVKGMNALQIITLRLLASSSSSSLGGASSSSGISGASSSSSSSAPAGIASVSIHVTTPAIGEAPDGAASTIEAGYSVGAAFWQPAHSPFQGGTVYTATVTLAADEGYTFAGLASAKINGSEASASSNTGGAVTLSHTFAATLAKAVTGMAIKTQPGKLAYTHRDPLSLAGLSVTLSYNDGSAQDVAAADFDAYNITTEPIHGEALSRSLHDGKGVKVGLGLHSATTGNLAVAAKELSDAMVNFNPGSLAYNGAAHTPSFTVTDGVALISGTDYVSAWAGNVNAGTATLTLSGIGNYSGSVARSFAISKAAGAAVSGPPVVSGRPTGTIAINAVTIPSNPGSQTVQYAISTSASVPASGWQTGTAFSDLDPAATYYIFARSAENANYSAGAAQVSNGVSTLLTGMAVKTQPSKLAYTQGDALNLAGLVVTLSYNDGTGHDVAFANFEAYGMMTIPNNGQALTHSLHNGESVRIELGSHAALTNALAVGKLAGAATSGGLAASSRTLNSITVSAATISSNPGGQAVEYAISASTTAPATGWQLETTFSSLISGTTYYVFVRSAENDSHNAGAVRRSSGMPTLGTCGETGYDPANRLCDSRDNKLYGHVTIGTQKWMAANLNYNASGSACYAGTDYSTSLSTTLSGTQGCDKYGRLYNWATAMVLASSCNTSSCSSQIQSSHKGVCPTGWHLPSDAEWTTLTDYVGSSTAGTKLQAASGWYNNGNGTNSYGFAALPGGLGDSGGSFLIAGYNGYWWSATESNASNAYLRNMDYDIENVDRYLSGKSYLSSVRCVQDNAP